MTKSCVFFCKAHFALRLIFYWFLVKCVITYIFFNVAHTYCCWPIQFPDLCHLLDLSLANITTWLKRFRIVKQSFQGSFFSLCLFYWLIFYLPRLLPFSFYLILIFAVWFLSIDLFYSLACFLLHLFLGLSEKILLTIRQELHVTSILLSDLYCVFTLHSSFPLWMCSNSSIFYSWSRICHIFVHFPGAIALLLALFGMYVCSMYTLLHFANSPKVSITYPRFTKYKHWMFFSEFQNDLIWFFFTLNAKSCAFPVRVCPGGVLLLLKWPRGRGIFWNMWPWVCISPLHRRHQKPVLLLTYPFWYLFWLVRFLKLCNM